MFDIVECRYYMFIGVRYLNAKIVLLIMLVSNKILI
jgi:hypothetical protein